MWVKNGKSASYLKIFLVKKEFEVSKYDAVTKQKETPKSLNILENKLN